MRRPSVTRVLLAALAAFTAACSDAPQQSQLSPELPRLTSGILPVLQLTPTRRTPIASDIKKSITLRGDAGGTIEIPEAGLRVDIPSGALPKSNGSTTITVTAYAGSQIAYEFEPAGTKFLRPAQFQQDLNSLTLTSSLLGRLLPSVSYFKTRTDLDPSSAVARTYENLLTSFDLSGHTMKADIWHFSGYVVAWGRNSGAE